ncbi:hypothetical protein FF1_041813 [Malus domestica]
MFYLYNKPLNIVDGNRQYLFDENERRYLDGVGGIATSSLSSLLGRTNLMELGFDLGGSGMEQAPLVKISVEPQSPTFSQAYKKKTYTVTFVAGSSPSGTSSFAVDRMIELPLR